MGFLNTVPTKKVKKTSSLYNAGWRPFVAWVCGIAFALNFILFPLLTWFIPIVSIWIPAAANVKAPAPFSLSEMMPVLFSLLGLGTLRSWDKKNNTEAK